MNPIRHFFISLYLLLLIFDGSAQTQQVKFNLVTGSNGVFLGKVNSVIQDKYGFIWISDQSNRCIVRYDGNRMTRYQYDPRKPNTLGGYYPECLFADTSGIIWIGFYGQGMDRFDPVTNVFTHYSHRENDPASLSDDFVSSILTDHLGNVWIGTYGGIDLLDQKTGTFKHFRPNPNDSTSLSNNKVRAIYEDKAGTLWVGTGFAFDPDSSGGLNRFNRASGTFTRFLHDPKNANSLIDNKVRTIFEDSRGDFWIGTRGDGLHRMDRNTGLITRLPYDASKPFQLSRNAVKNNSDHITFITEDSDKNLWIGTLANGVLRYNPETKKMVHYGDKPDDSGPYKENSSWWAYASKDGLIWISTQASKLYLVDLYNNIIPHYGSDNEGEGLSSFNEESGKVYWYGTDNGLVRKEFKNANSEESETVQIKKIVHNPLEKNSLSNNSVRSLLKDYKGNMWVGTDAGLNLFNLKTEQFIQIPGELGLKLKQLSFGYSLYYTKDSTLWIGSVGLYKLDYHTSRLTSYANVPSDNKSLSNDLVTSIFEDPYYNLWIGTENNGGLNKLDRQTGTFKHYLPGLGISCIYMDSDTVLWVGAPNGLFKYDRSADEYYSYNEKNVGSDILGIASMIEDDEKNLWISSYSGISKLNKTRDKEILYAAGNGVINGNNFYYGSAFKKENGTLIFGAVDGYYAFNPDRLKMAPGSNLLYFTNFWINSQPIIPGNNSSFKESIYTAQDIQLRYDQNVFSFGFTSINFRDQGEHAIFYKLENYDADWRTSGNSDRVHYYKVPPGKYTFKIKSTDNKDGGWMEKSIRVIISPPWWKTWWAYSLLGLLFLFLGYVFDRSQKERIIKAERERSREVELSQAKAIEKAYTELKSTQSQLVQAEKMASLGELTAGIAH
ncbi:MAG: two-component regulator propeller domain-containing protein, partial [Saprospiraceae bacterium]